MPYSRETYPFVDVLRGLAAMLVVVFHAMQLGGRNAFPPGQVWHFFDYGWIGVNLFLLISGLVITQSMLRHMEQAQDRYRRPFIANRLARILPLYLLTGIAFLLVADPAWLHGALPGVFKHLGSHLAFVHNLHRDTHGSLNGPNWSIALEMQFYLVMVLIAPWLIRLRAAHLAGVVLLAILFRYAITLLVPAGDTMMRFIGATQLPGIADHFALGIAVALALHRAQRGAWLKAGWRSFCCALAASAVLLSLAGFLLVAHGYWGNDWMVTFVPSLVAAGFAALLVAAVTFPLAEAAIFGPLRYLGEISYGLYLWHLPVLLFTLNADPQLKGIPFLATVCGATCLFASLSWHLLEKPVIVMARGYGRGTHPGTASQLPSTQFQ